MCCWGVHTDADELLLLRRKPILSRSADGLVNRPDNPRDENWGPVHWELYTAASGDRDVAAEQPDEVVELARYLDGWPDHPSSDPDVVHGAVADRPDLRAALRQGGYWTAEPDSAAMGQP